MSRKEVDLHPRSCSELFQTVSLRPLEISDSRVRQVEGVEKICVFDLFVRSHTFYF